MHFAPESVTEPTQPVAGYHTAAHTMAQQPEIPASNRIGRNRSLEPTMSETL